MYGWFHPGAFGAWQATRRGFDRRIGMPGGSQYPANMYSEHIVAARSEITFVASSVSAQSLNPYDVGVCRTFRKAVLMPDHSYELVFGGQNGACALELFELKLTAGGSTSRIPVQTTLTCGALH
jgi:hypothetical protein